MNEPLKRVLAEPKSEHEVHAFLKEHPRLLAEAFIPIDRSGYVLSKPKAAMGGMFEPDFVLLESMSGAWIVHLVELEPPQEKLFTTTGFPDQRLKGALRQIEDWKGHLSNPVNELLFRREISKSAQNEDLLCPYWIPRSVTCSAGFALSDPDTTMSMDWHVVIGRRDAETDDSIRHKAQLARERGISVRTYDCFLDLNWSDS